MQVNLSAGEQVSGILPVANGGTGVSALTAAGFVVANGSGSLSTLLGTAANQEARWNGSAWIAALPSYMNANHATVSTQETTTSTTYTDLATVTDTVTVTIGPSGMALVILTSYIQVSSTGLACYVSPLVSGANSIAAADTNALNMLSASSANAPTLQMSNVQLLSGLAQGATTFKMKYRVTGGTGTFKNRSIAVVPL